MSIQSAPYFWVFCDLCGSRSTGEYEAWVDAEQAEMVAADSDWHVEGGNHLCYECTPLSRDDDALSREVQS